MTWDHLVERGLVKRGVPLAGLTTYRFGGPARLLAEVASTVELSEVVGANVADPVPMLVLGRGSNLVISDSGFDGCVIRLAGDFSRVEVVDDQVTAGGAVPMPRLARTAVRESRRGLEFLVGIPGSVGGGVTMNAGCFGSEIADWLVTAQLVDLTTGGGRIADPAGLDLRYRHSNVAGSEVVVAATFHTDEGSIAGGGAIMREVTQWRKRSQPGGTHNAGSVFKNPDGDTAGRLIEAAGLKGFAVGGAMVSEHHANFFIASDDARAQDVFELVDRVKALVAERTGVVLTPEIRFAGEFAGRRDDVPDGGDPPLAGEPAPT